MHIPRRRFLHVAALAAAGVGLSPLEPLLARISRGASLRAAGFGPLRPDPRGLLDLPAGFAYHVLSGGVLDEDRADEGRFAEALTNGDPVPTQHDGQAAFAGPNGLTVIVRNHEMNLEDRPFVDPGHARPWDPAAPGGTTTLWVDRDRRVVRAFASLSGTLRNCAGGATPWGTWLSAEEDVAMPGAIEAHNADRTPNVQKPHGYVFEVDSRADGLADPVPLRSMGRFRHEAVAVDPATGFVYLTEDRGDGLLYRWRPHAVERDGVLPARLRPGDFARGGTLEALRIRGLPQALTQNHEREVMRLGERHAVEWVPIPDPDPDCDMRVEPADVAADPKHRRVMAAKGSTRMQGIEAGCAQFSRCEGIVLQRRSVFFCATDGGRRQLGQVFRLDLARQELALVVEPNDPALLDSPDNLCPAPWGDLVVCEDGSDDNFVLGLTPAGRLYPIARGAHPRHAEFAGATFAPDGRTLFVNLQRPGLTFAI
jgi:hypothetical protein